jgi:hypothetical protein
MHGVYVTDSKNLNMISIHKEMYLEMSIDSLLFAYTMHFEIHQNTRN